MNKSFKGLEIIKQITEQISKPSGYEIHWYKYPCREAYGNQSKTIEEFREIIQGCISSLGAK